MKILIHDNMDSWDNALAFYKSQEPCQGYAMHSAYTKCMKASKIILLEVSNHIGFVLYPVLLIPVPRSLTNYDLFTAESVYGFSGPVCSGTRDFLVEAFELIAVTLSEVGVVAEFLRTSPFLNIPISILVESGYTFKQDRQLAIWRRPKSFHDSNQQLYLGNMERRALKAGCRFSFGDVGTDEFQQLYYQTMRLNVASEFFMYSSDYFNILSKESPYLTNHLFAVRHGSQLISSAWFITANNHSVYHLGCNDRSIPGASDLLLRCSSDYLSNSLGVTAINFTGGRSLDLADSLLKFKMRFANATEHFVVGRRIIDHSAFSTIISNNTEHLDHSRLIPWS